MSEHCVGATGLGLVTVFVYTHVRIYAFSIYLIYAADVMPSLSLGRDTKGRYEEYLATALNSTSSFRFLQPERETMRIAFLWKIAVGFCARDEGIMPRRCGKSNPLPPSPVTMLPVRTDPGEQSHLFAKASRPHS